MIRSPDPCILTNGFHQIFKADDCRFNNPEAIPIDDDMHIHPNPTTDLIIIKLEKGFIQDVKIYNSIGAWIRMYDFGQVAISSIDME